MSNIINFTNQATPLSAELLRPAEAEAREIAESHAAEPIKDVATINRISDYLRENNRYRDNMLFIVGINFGLRVSDLRELRFADIIDDNMCFRASFPVFERKTREKRKKKINRIITVNQAAKDAITEYLQHTQGVSRADYLFRSESNRGGEKPLTPKSIDRILKGIGEDLELDIKMSTHTLRKTFCYHQMKIADNDPRKLLLLQKILNHSSASQTLDYIGITPEEISAAYTDLNLGGGNGQITPLQPAPAKTKQA